MYLSYSRPLIYHLLPNVWKLSYNISTSIFLDVPYRPPYSTDKFIYCVVPGPSQWFFCFGKVIVIAWTQDKTTTLGGHTAAAITDLLRRWIWEILEHPPYSPDRSYCDYYLFANVKEPLRGTRYNTRDELIHALGRSIQMDAFQTFGKR